MTTNEEQPNAEMTKQQEQEMLEKILKSVEKTRKMFLWTLILSVVAFILPIIGLAFAIPYFINTYLSTFSDITTQFGL